MEIWKTIESYPNYQVSNMGKVRGKKGYPLRYRLVKGYPVTNLRVKGNRSPGSKKVHRLVLDTFVGKRPKLQCNHIDGGKKNNSLENLEWVTGQENMDHAVKYGLMAIQAGEHNGNAKLTNERVLLIRKIKSKLNLPDRVVAKMFRVSLATINYITNRKTWSHI